MYISFQNKIQLHSGIGVRHFVIFLRLLYVVMLQVKAFVQLTLTPSVCEGLHHLVRAAGIGGLQTNTVCLGFYDKCTPTDRLTQFQIRKKGLFGSKAIDAELGDIGVKFRGIRQNDGVKDLDVTEYVKMIADSLKMQKNVMLCRNFINLKKADMLDSKGTMFIDVWPVNFFRPETSSYFDNTCLFLLQLACILNMVRQWKPKTTLRVFLLDHPDTDTKNKKEEKLERYLRELRIPARIQLVAWDTVAQSMASQVKDQTINYPDSQLQDYNVVDDNYIKEINETISSFTARTAVTFLYLPLPPTDASLSERYLQQLDALSAQLPPTVFVHGLHPVTSTSL